jgi:hypothetical protein
MNNDRTHFLCRFDRHNLSRGKSQRMKTDVRLVKWSEVPIESSADPPLPVWGKIVNVSL